MTSVSMPSSRTERVASRRLPVAALVAAVAAAVGNLLLFFVAGAALANPLEIQMGGPGSPVVPLSATPIILTSTIPAFVAAGFLALLGRFTRRPFLIFQVVAVVFLVLSLGGPLSLPVATSTKVVLSLMHVIAAAAIVGVLSRMGRETA